MAEAPTPEELQAKRDELAALRKSNIEKQAAKNKEADDARRAAEYDRLEREIEFEAQAAAILGDTPPEAGGQEVLTPPDNSTPSAAPTYGSNWGSTQPADNDETEEA